MLFYDREHAGRVLAGLLKDLDDSGCVVLAIPNGGVPVAIQIADALHAELGVEIVRKLQVPGNTEAGFGAVTSGGDIILNEQLVRQLGLDGATIRTIADRTLEEVRRRQREFGAAPIKLWGRTVILVDDGLASGYTMMAAARSVRRRGPKQVIVAVPTSSAHAAALVAGEADRFVCPDVREGPAFAVADAYEDWYDLTVHEASAMLQAWQGRHPSRNAPRA